MVRISDVFFFFLGGGGYFPEMLLLKPNLYPLESLPFFNSFVDNFTHINIIIGEAIASPIGSILIALLYDKRSDYMVVQARQGLSLIREQIVLHLLTNLFSPTSFQMSD